MIYVKPRKMMNVDRMRRQREKHLPLRYQKWTMSRDTIVLLGQDGWEAHLSYLLDDFRMQVLRWNMWQKRELSDIMLYRDFDIDYNTERIIFECYRKPRNNTRNWRGVMGRMMAENILTPNEVRVAFGLKPR